MAQTRRNWIRMAVASTVALLVMVVPVLAKEIRGMLSKVDVENNKITVVQKGDKETVLTVTDDTEYATPKKTGTFNPAKVAKAVEKATAKGRPGIPVVVTYEDDKASKVELKAGKGKGKGKNKKKKDD